MSVKQPYISFAEVKCQVTIPDVMVALGIYDRLQWKGDSASGICPLPSHQHRSNPNPNQFKVNNKDGHWLFHCFGCHRGGDVVEFVKAVTGYDNKSVRFWFADKFGVRLHSTTANGEQKLDLLLDYDKRQGIANQAFEIDSSTPKELKPLPFNLQLDNSVTYLRERGLTSETIQRYGLGFCSRGVLQGYIAIPIYMHTQSAEENPVAYLGRWCGEDFDEAAGRPRYRWPTGFAKSRVVYGLREALVGPKSQPLIVVEGPFKLYHVVQAGFPNTVAIFGSSVSEEQARILTETDRPIILLFDGDEAGQTGMKTAADKLINSAFIRAIYLNDNKAPDDFSTEELQNILSFINFKRLCNTGCP
jgi:DNA primase